MRQLAQKVSQEGRKDEGAVRQGGEEGSDKEEIESYTDES